MITIYMVLTLFEDAPESRGFFENLMTTIMNSLQVHIRNVHIRYEDSTMNRDSPFACGICIQGISIETTNRYSLTEVNC